MRGSGFGSSTPSTSLEQEPHQPFHQPLNLRLVEERGLDVELRELRLPIGAQILVAEAAHDLVVAVEARNHQQLLVDLRRLRQREELARMRAARHQVVARAFRRRLGQHRRLDVDEARIVEIAAHGARDAMAQQQALAHLLAAQIEVAEAQAHLLAHVLIELERQRLGAVQDLERTGTAARPARISRCGFTVPVGRRRTDAGDLQHELVAHALGLREHLGGIRIEHDLQQPLAVAQVDEDDAAVVAAAMGPAGHRDDLADRGFADLAAIVSAHKLRTAGKARDAKA